ncbi:MAG: methionine adenosyltransferase domain-containing protein [Lentisphaeria bacterium]|nr:methionine adenosyltransferase domain-containing protein [Lentisphaeria bacterium]
MKLQIAEYVSLGHPDRLADAVVEKCVDCAVVRDPDALVGLECAVHTDKVFLDGRIAAGHSRPAVTHQDLEALARAAYRDAGYGDIWRPAPNELKVIQDVCLEALDDDERSVRCYADDQSVVAGYACNSPATAWLPAAHYIANRLGVGLAQWQTRATNAELFGPDFKILVQIGEDGRRYVWDRLTLSIQHREGVEYPAQYALLRPVIARMLAELEQQGIGGIGALPDERFMLNGAGDFIQGGPEGDNGLSGKKLAIDFYGPEIPIGGGAICGKDPHKVDVCGAFRARELACQLVRERGYAAVSVRLGWSPGETAPAFREVTAYDLLGFSRPIPPSCLPPAEWFDIATVNRDLQLAAIHRAERLKNGYFFPK